MRVPRGILLLALFLAACRSATPNPDDPVPERAPNVVLVLVDDLGWGELGCYGQSRIRTPHLDQLAREGLRFTQGYSGAPVCAPSRCALLTGRDPEHMHLRDNEESRGANGNLVEGQAPLAPGTPTIATVLRAQGYVTAAIGKWGLGGPGSGSEPRDHGFDRFFGYLCQRHAHDHYPAYLWDNARRIELPGNVPDRLLGESFADELLVERALAFLDEPHDRPFLLYFAPALPHLALQVPDADVREYAFDETPYDGKKGYRAHPTPRAAYAAMISRLDRDVGRIVAKLRERKLERDTLVVFTSDNGPTHDVGGVDTSFFDSTGGLRGRKGSVHEGGLRVPWIAWWPGRIEAGTTSQLPISAWDVLATCAQLGNSPAPITEGESFADVLLGAPRVERHARIAWTFPGYGGQVAIRDGSWKVVQRELARGGGPVQAFDLAADPNEKRPLELTALPPEVRARAMVDLERLRPLAAPR